MNFYPFHLGDYCSHTKHLSLMEDLAYRRMIDLYYTTEQPLPNNAEKIARLIGMREQVKEVETILDDFFVLTENEYKNARCEREIENYQLKASRAKNANLARWSGKNSDLKSDNDQKSCIKSDLISDIKSECDQIPTNNQEPITNTNNQNIETHASKLAISVGNEKTKMITLQTFLDQCEERQERPLRNYQPLWDYAAKVKLEQDLIGLAWEVFKGKFIGAEVKQKKYTNWRLTFLNYLKGNYLKLWYVDENGSYQLTQAGKQAQMEHGQ